MDLTTSDKKKPFKSNPFETADKYRPEQQKQEVQSGGGSAIRLEVKEATEIGEFYNLPQSLVSIFFIKFNDTLYPKEAFLLMQGHKRGIQAIEITRPESELLNDENGEYYQYECEARIYPKLDKQVVIESFKLPSEERRELLAYLSKPTIEWGRSSIRTVRMKTMHHYLPEMSIKRAVCRALRLYVGIGLTAWEEMPNAEVSEEELRELKKYKVAEKQ